jgi:pyruvate dehydrogenase E1 component
MLERRRQLGGCLPKRSVVPVPLTLPKDDVYAEFQKGTAGSVPVSTTMAFVRLLRKLMKDPQLGRRVVPIIPDEARTFGMESLFKEFHIYAAHGQKYTPVDAQVLLSYSEAKDGQILEEGITEAGSMASTTAAGTCYSTHRQPMVPFFIFYSMFGFQRVGDMIWAFADARGRGFLMGATAGRTTLSGEGLQHQDGHSLLVASTVPACQAYDPAFAYETAAIVQDGLRRMNDDGEDIFYYIALYNENYEQPSLPEGVRDGILKGLYRFRRAPQERPLRAHLLASGPIVLQALRAQELLARLDVAADVWSATSFVNLRREALDCDRHNRLHPAAPPHVPYVTQCLEDDQAVYVGVGDHVRTVPDLIARWVPGEYIALGADAFGRSDTREALRRFHEIDAEHIAVAALAALARRKRLDPKQVARAMQEWGVTELPQGSLV